jgi:hypothetical protein
MYVDRQGWGKPHAGLLWMNVNNWKKVTQNRDRRKKVVE